MLETGKTLGSGFAGSQSHECWLHSQEGQYAKVGPEGIQRLEGDRRQIDTEWAALPLHGEWR
jgi:hypothetical protein